jgi:hypothetical protein
MIVQVKRYTVILLWASRYIRIEPNVPSVGFVLQDLSIIRQPDKNSPYFLQTTHILLRTQSTLAPMSMSKLRVSFFVAVLCMTRVNGKDECTKIGHKPVAPPGVTLRAQASLADCCEEVGKLGYVFGQLDMATSLCYGWKEGVSGGTENCGERSACFALRPVSVRDPMTTGRHQQSEREESCLKVADIPNGSSVHFFNVKHDSDFCCSDCDSLGFPLSRRTNNRFGPNCYCYKLTDAPNMVPCDLEDECKFRQSYSTISHTAGNRHVTQPQGPAGTSGEAVSFISDAIRQLERAEDVNECAKEFAACVSLPHDMKVGSTSSEYQLVLTVSPEAKQVLKETNKSLNIYKKWSLDADANTVWNNWIPSELQGSTIGVGWDEPLGFQFCKDRPSAGGSSFVCSEVSPFLSNGQLVTYDGSNWSEIKQGPSSDDVSVEYYGTTGYHMSLYSQNAGAGVAFYSDVNSVSFRDKITGHMRVEVFLQFGRQIDAGTYSGKVTGDFFTIDMSEGVVSGCITLDNNNAPVVSTSC